MATKRQISKVLYKGEEYDIIGANVNDVEVSIKNGDGTVEYGKFSTNQKTPKTINIPVPNIDSALNGNSTNPVQNKVVKQALDTKITNPSGGTTGQVLKKTANGEEWADESGGGGGDEIVCLTQDEYDALTPEEEMNGTYYGIVGDGISDTLTSGEITSLARFLRGGGTTIDLAGESINGTDGKIYEIPSDCNIIYINVEFKTSSNYYHLSGSYLFTRGLDYRQFGADLFGSSSNKWFTAEVDWSTYELKLRSNDSSDSIYAGHITYC